MASIIVKLLNEIKKLIWPPDEPIGDLPPLFPWELIFTLTPK